MYLIYKICFLSINMNKYEMSCFVCSNNLNFICIFAFCISNYSNFFIMKKNYSSPYFSFRNLFLRLMSVLVFENTWSTPFFTQILAKRNCNKVHVPYNIFVSFISKLRNEYSFFPFLFPKIICLAFLFFAYTGAQAQATAGKATTGSGLYKDKILWLNWDLNNNGLEGDPIPNNQVRTYLAPSGVTYTVTISNLVNTITSQWTYDYTQNNFPSGYGNIGGNTGAGNVIGIGPGAAGTSSFKITVVANYPGGSTGNAAAFVIAGTESLN